MGELMSAHSGFFDLDERYAALSAAGNPLLRLGELIDLEVFGGSLLRAFRRSDPSMGGRPPYDTVLIFKILVKHGEATVGGYGPSLAPQRGPAGTPGPRLQDPLPQASGEDHAGTEGQRQCRARQGRLSDRAPYRPSEGADELARLHHRHRPGSNQDRHGEPRLQHVPVRLA